MKLSDNSYKNKRTWTIRIIVGCLLLQMLLTLPLWWSEGRSFPIIPIFSFLPVLESFFWTMLLPSFFVINLLFVFVFSDNRVGLFAALFCASLLIMFDVNRLQIWMYQWLFMLLVLAFLKEKSRWKFCLQLMIIALYFWSGFNKLNVYFIDHSFPWLMDTFSATQPIGKSFAFALFSAFLEIGIAIGLLLDKTRKFACITAFVMHALILLILGPLGLNWNQPVWPWNLAMILLVYLLFYTEPFAGFSTLRNKGILSKLILLIWAVMPLGNVFEIWDEQLSFKMYSGTNPEGILIDSSIEPNCFPDSAKVYYTRSTKEVENRTQEEQILIDEWALNEMKVPPYASQRTFKEIGRQWCACLETPKNGRLEVLRVNRWNRKERPNLSYNCEELLD